MKLIFTHGVIWMAVLGWAAPVQSGPVLSLEYRRLNLDFTQYASEFFVGKVDSYYQCSCEKADPLENPIPKTMTVQFENADGSLRGKIDDNNHFSRLGFAFSKSSLLAVGTVGLQDFFFVFRSFQVGQRLIAALYYFNSALGLEENSIDALKVDQASGFPFGFCNCLLSSPRQELFESLPQLSVGISEPAPGILEIPPSILAGFDSPLHSVSRESGTPWEPLFRLDSVSPPSQPWRPLELEDEFGVSPILDDKELVELENLLNQ